MKIRQHIPNFCDGYTPKQAEFDSLEELLELDWIKRWTEHKDFHQWSLSENYLMAEVEEGKTWWVVGRLTGDTDKLGLPEWEKEKNERLQFRVQT